MHQQLKPVRAPGPRNLGLIQLASYRLPAAGFVSILHRLSGLLLLAGLPFVIWCFDASLRSADSFEHLRSVILEGAHGLPVWPLKLLLIALTWAFAHHSIAGLRFLWIDVTHQTGLDGNRWMAGLTVSVGLLAAGLTGYRLFS